MGLKEAVVTGGRTRLRPVLMTSLTTIFGMVPLALSRGEGSEVWNALGITIMGGLMVSGFVTLILVPLLYSLVHRRSRLIDEHTNIKKECSQQEILVWQLRQ
jgi:HAE1 family hydrophobic/amphiphilic exporter-1